MTQQIRHHPERSAAWPKNLYLEPSLCNESLVHNEVNQ
jgi:hypothetical protein